MRIYADLHLCPSLDDASNAESMAKILMKLGVRLVGLVIPPDRLPYASISQTFKTNGLDVATRLDLRPKSREELLRDLRRLRNRYELVSVECGNPSVTRVAVRDRRVDIVYFPRDQRGSAFRENIAHTCQAALEFNLSELTSGSGFAPRLRSVRQEIRIADQASTAIIGSTRASKPFELRSPRDVASILHSVGLPLKAALKAVSDIPISLVKENRARLAKPRLEEGVRVMRRSARYE